MLNLLRDWFEKRFAFRLAVFLFPLVFLFFLENAVLDRSAFTYRHWETFSTHAFGDYFPGRFYPLQEDHRWEMGDQRREGPPLRETQWVTDKYGQRNIRLPERGEAYGVVVGDSNSVGSSLDQDQTLASQLQERSGILHINLGFEYWAPHTHPVVEEAGKPSHIILELKRGYLVMLNQSMETVHNRFIERRTKVSPLLIRADHATKLCMWNAARARVGTPAINLIDQFRYPHLKYPRDWMGAWLSGSKVEQNADLEEMEQAVMNASDLNPGVAAITWLARECEEAGIRFIVLVLPDGYREADEPIRQLQSQGVEVIGFMPTEEHPHGTDMAWFWQPHDSHWTPEAVEHCADLVAEQLQSIPTNLVTTEGLESRKSNESIR